MDRSPKFIAPEPLSEIELTRREFIESAAAASGVAASESALQAETIEQSTLVPFDLTVNGQNHYAALDPRVTLLDFLREHLQLTGTKKGCDHGQCGACTVIAGAQRVLSCLSLAVAYDGARITTIEGLAKGAALHPMQQSFLDHDGLQCGFCTSGQICSAVAMLQEAWRGAASRLTTDLRKRGPVRLSPEEISERMSGNICRCGAYPNIVAAIHMVAQKGNSETNDEAL